MALSPPAHRRTLRLQMKRIQRKIDKTQEEIEQLEQGQFSDPPRLFTRQKPGLKSLQDKLKHLRSTEEQIKKDLRSA